MYHHATTAWSSQALPVGTATRTHDRGVWASARRHPRPTTTARRVSVPRAEPSEGRGDAPGSAQPSSEPDPSSLSGPPQPQRSERSERSKRQADSTDAISSALTRRFGLAGGLAWLGFLTFGVVSEQIKTRREVAAEERGTKAVTTRTIEKIPGTSVTYTDEKIGGGARPQQGDLVVLNIKGYAVVNGEKQLFVDTSDTGKPIVLVYKSRPFTAGNCLGVELALEDMRAGGKRQVNVPNQYGFGDQGTSLKPSRHVPDKEAIVPPGADLSYELELVRVSIPPS